MNINVICCGKLKETFWREAAAEYSKRLARYCKLNITEVKDEPIGGGFDTAAAIKKEGERLLAAMPLKSLKIALCVDGERISSGGLAQTIAEAKSNAPDISFIIGGTAGLSADVLAACNRKISVSDMTFTHQLARVVLLEQIYRAFKIIEGEPYHR